MLVKRVHIAVMERAWVGTFLTITRRAEVEHGKCNNHEAERDQVSVAEPPDLFRHCCEDAGQAAKVDHPVKGTIADG